MNRFINSFVENFPGLLGKVTFFSNSFAFSNFSIIFAALYNKRKMKKVVRTVWIGALTGIAFLGACCSSSGLSRKERKQLVKERDSIQEILKMREMAAVYGSPEVIANYGTETARLRCELDSINARLGENVDLEKSGQVYQNQTTRADLLKRIADLRKALEMRESACIYGSPEMMQEYGKRTQEMRDELHELETQLEELNK